MDICRDIRFNVRKIRETEPDGKERKTPVKSPDEQESCHVWPAGQKTCSDTWFFPENADERPPGGAMAFFHRA